MFSNTNEWSQLKYVRQLDAIFDALHALDIAIWECKDLHTFLVSLGFVFKFE